MKQITYFKTWLFAIVFMVAGGGFVWADKFVKIASHTDVTETDVYMIVDVTSGTALTSANGTTAAPSAVSIPLVGDIIEGDIADALKWKFEAVDGGYVIYPVGNDATWLYSTNSNNGIRVGTNTSKVFELNIVSGGYKGFKHIALGRYLGVYNNQDWRTYTSVHANIASTQIEIFKLDTTVPVVPTIGGQGTVDFVGLVGENFSQTITITGLNLTDDISVSGATDPFAVSSSTLDAAGGDLTIIYTPTTAGSHNATLTLSSSGADDKIIELTGEAFITVGDGSQANPFTVADVKLLNNSLASSTKYWVKGVIIGFPSGGNADGLTTVALEAPFGNTAIALSDVPNETDLSTMIGVQLPAGDVREALNLEDNSENLNKEVLVYGTLEGYFSGAPGVKNVTDYVLDSGATPCTPAAAQFADATLEKEVTDAPFTNIFTSNENTNPVAYSSSNTDVATVDAATGEVTLVGAGTTTISATQDADGTYCAVNVSYSLTVKAVLPPVVMPNVIITEVYGAGGNNGAIYKNDYFEIFNPSGATVDVGGWSLQYYSATGTGKSSNLFVFSANTKIRAGQHFLIEGAGGSNGVDLPTPDGTSSINAAAGSGKLILFSTDEAQTISDLNSILNNSNFVDYLPYGATAVPVWGGCNRKYIYHYLINKKERCCG